MEELKENQIKPEAAEAETPLDKNVRMMSPTQMLMRRFFRSKLSILGLVMVVGLFLFCFFGPMVYTRWAEKAEQEQANHHHQAQNTQL